MVETKKYFGCLERSDDPVSVFEELGVKEFIDFTYGGLVRNFGDKLQIGHRREDEKPLAVFLFGVKGRGLQDDTQIAQLGLIKDGKLIKRMANGVFVEEELDDLLNNYGSSADFKIVFLFE